jgi:hypothetical protein
MAPKKRKVSSSPAKGKQSSKLHAPAKDKQSSSASSSTSSSSDTKKDEKTLYQQFIYTETSSDYDCEYECTELYEGKSITDVMRYILMHNSTAYEHEVVKLREAIDNDEELISPYDRFTKKELASMFTGTYQINLNTLTSDQLNEIWNRNCKYQRENDRGGEDTIVCKLELLTPSMFTRVE